MKSYSSKNNKFTIIAIFCLCLLLSASSAYALMIDYATIANVEGERGYAAYDRMFSAVTVTATATDLSGTVDYFAYLDKNSGGKKGGLGVCKSLTSSNQCTPSSDDNLTAAEKIHLSFDKPVTISEIIFRDGMHNASFAYPDNDFDLFINSAFLGSFTLQHIFNVPLPSAEMFSFVASAGGTDIDEMYIEKITFTPVPEPASLLLLASGLLGIGIVRSRMC